MELQEEINAVGIKAKKASYDLALINEELNIQGWPY